MNEASETKIEKFCNKAYAKMVDVFSKSQMSHLTTPLNVLNTWRDIVKEFRENIEDTYVSFHGEMAARGLIRLENNGRCYLVIKSKDILSENPKLLSDML